MLRFLQKVWPEPGRDEGNSLGLALPWAVLLAGMLGVVFVLPEPESGMLGALLSFSSLWPVLLGAAIFTVAVWAGRRADRALYPKIPEGDLLIPLMAALDRLSNALASGGASVRQGYEKLAANQSRRLRGASNRLDEASVLTELWLRRWTVAGGLVFTLMLAVFALAALS